MNGFSFMMLLVIFVPLVIVLAITPYLVRRTECFGVSIPSDVFDRAELKAMRKKFAWTNLMFGVLCAAITFSFPNQLAWLAPVAITSYLVFHFIVYLRFHFQMKKLKEMSNWLDTKKQAIVIDLEFQNKRPIVSNMWYLIGGFFTLATVVCTFVFYDRIPETIPMQYDFQGNVTTTATKSIGSVLFLPVVQLVMLLIFLFVNMIIARSKQQLDPNEPEISAEQNLIFRRRWSLFTVWLGHGMVLLFTVIQCSFIFTIDLVWLTTLTSILVGGSLIGAVLLAISTGQGGSRIRNSSNESVDKINRDDDHYWKLGTFYFNPDDPALWLEKRFGVGWTANLARPLIWLIFIGVLALAFLPFLFI